MNTTQARTTRLWWDGREVHFIRWTDSALVFAWRGTDDTAMHIPRGAVVRLIERGVIGIEGAVPDWLGAATVPDVTRPLTLPPHPAPAPDPSPAPAEDAKASRLNLVARLIRKLGGDPSRGRALKPLAPTPKV